MALTDSDFMAVRQSLMSSLRSEFRKQESRDDRGQRLSENTIKVLKSLGLKINDIKKPVINVDLSPIKKDLRDIYQQMKMHSLTLFYRDDINSRKTAAYRKENLKWLEKIYMILKKGGGAGGGGGKGGGIFGNIGHDIAGALEGLGIFDLIKAPFKFLAGKAWDLAKYFGKLVKGGLEKAWDLLIDGAESAGGLLKKAGGYVWDGLKSAVSDLKGAIGRLASKGLDFVKNAAGEAWDFGKSLVGKAGDLFDAGKSALGDAGEGIAALGGAGAAVGATLGAGGVVLSYEGAQKNKGISTLRNKLSLVGGAASGTMMGAELGSFIGPEGTAIGAAIGALGGAGVVLFKEYHHTIMKYVDKFKKWGINAISKVTGFVSTAWKDMTKWLASLPAYFKKKLDNLINIFDIDSKHATHAPKSRRHPGFQPAAPTTPAPSPTPKPNPTKPLVPPSSQINPLPIKKSGYDIYAKSKEQFSIENLFVRNLVVGNKGVNDNKNTSNQGFAYAPDSSKNKNGITLASYTVGNKPETVLGGALGYIQSMLRNEKAFRLPLHLSTKGQEQVPLGSATPAYAGGGSDYSTRYGKKLTPNQVLKINKAIKSQTKSKFLRNFEFQKMQSEGAGYADPKNSSSTAQGAFQFETGTWADMIKKYPQFHFTMADIKNPVDQAVMTVLYDKGTLAELKRHHDKINNASIYGGYFLGQGGVLSFEKDLKNDPNGIAANYFPKAAKDNKAMFYHKNGQARTLTQIDSLLNKRISIQPNRKEQVAQAKSMLGKPVANDASRSANMADKYKKQTNTPDLPPQKNGMIDTAYRPSMVTVPEIEKVPMYMSPNNLPPGMFAA